MKLQLTEDNPFKGRPSYNELAPILLETPVNLPEWEVEQILDAKPQYSSLWYMVQYKGYDTSHNQWIKHSDVFVLEAITEFYCKYPAKPRTIATATFNSLAFQDPSLHTRFI